MEDADPGRALGRLEARAEETTRQLTALFKAIDAMRRDFHEQSGAVRALAGEHAMLVGRVSAMEPAVADYKALKLKGLGVLGVIALLGSGAGVGLTKLFHLFGGPQ
jgi:hypothetical protein